MVFRTLIAALLLITTVTTSHAADDVQIDDARFDWSGSYAGLLVSYNWIEDDWVDPALPPGSLFGTVDAEGISGGVLIGHNWQNGDWIFGVEADIEYGSIGGWERSDAVNWFGFAEMNWQGSLRGRLGRVVNGYNVYATGGLAAANFDLDYNGVAVHLGDQYNDTLTGWTAGAGIEKMFNNGLIGRAEYRYSDFGSSEGTITNCCALLPFRQRHEITSSKVNFAIIKKF